LLQCTVHEFDAQVIDEQSNAQRGTRNTPTHTYHLVQRAEWEATDAAAPYTPVGFEREGFVHCTDGAEEVAATANRFFADLKDDLMVLVLDRDRLNAPVRYDDPRQIYPHIYGPVDRDAIVEALLMSRDANGKFVPPDQ
jgi:uncharacterized protein (DUF952 family)